MGAQLCVGGFNALRPTSVGRGWCERNQVTEFLKISGWAGFSSENTELVVVTWEEGRKKNGPWVAFKTPEGALRADENSSLFLG